MTDKIVPVGKFSRVDCMTTEELRALIEALDSGDDGSDPIFAEVLADLKAELAKR